MDLLSYFPKDICNIIDDYQYFKTFMDMLKFENTTYKQANIKYICNRAYKALMKVCTENIHISPTFNICCIANYDKIGLITVTIYKSSEYIVIFDYINGANNIFMKYTCSEICRICLLQHKFKIIYEIFEDNIQIIPIHKFNIYDFLKIKKYNEAFRDSQFMIKLFSYFKQNSYVLRMLKDKYEHTCV
jgi:hypothetical protein